MPIAGYVTEENYTKSEKCLQFTLDVGTNNLSEWPRVV